jgi:hypothetical protein
MLIKSEGESGSSALLPDDSSILKTNGEAESIHALATSNYREKTLPNRHTVNTVHGLGSGTGSQTHTRNPPNLDVETAVLTTPVLYPNVRKRLAEGL